MNWKFWERARPAERAAPLTQEEEHDMGLYLRREETPEGAFMAQLQAREAEENRYGQPDPAEGEDDQEPAEPPDLIASAPPEIQQAVEARLAQERQQMRASLGQIGIDLTPDGRPAFRDMSRLQAAAGWQGQAPQQPAQQQQQPPPQPQPLIPVPELDDPEDGEIPDPQYAPREYRQWLDRRNQYHLAQALNKALAPVMSAVTRIGQGTTQMYINQAVDQVENAVQQHMPWISGVLDHPSFEAAFRQALSQIEPDKWQTPQDLAAVAGMVAPYLPPLADAQFYQPQQQQPAPPPRVSKKGRYQQQYEQPQYQDPGYLPEPPPPGPARGTGERNERGQFVGRRAAAAAVSQAAAQQAAPSRGGGRPTVAEQYDQVVLEAAVRGGISPEEVKALMQDSTGDAAEVFRKKRRLEALK